MTKHHVFGKRFLALLGPEEAMRMEVEADPNGKIARRKQGHVWSKQIRRICGKCNNGWMRKLEEDSFDVMRDLIYGGLDLPQSKQELVAARLAHIAMVGALSIYDSTQPIDGRERRYLMRHQAAPPDWQIFLARADVPSIKNQYFNLDAFAPGSHTGVAANPDQRSAVITFVLGRLCAHILTWPRTGIGYAGIRLLQISPAQHRDLSLVEADLLEGDRIEQLANAIKRQLDR